MMLTSSSGEYPLGANMKVDDRISNYTHLNSDTSNNAGRSRENAAPKGMAENRAVNVEISSAAKQMSEDEERLERLKAIRQQLAEGTYSISGKDVANKILKVLKS